MSDAPRYDLAPLLPLALLGAALAAGAFAWVWRRHRGAPAAARLRALTLLTLFLTFDLVVFGSYTRRSASGLGCPDWPGCYGSATPLGAADSIADAERALPSGAVTRAKAWVEMLHRYLATGVGALIALLAVTSWIARRRGEAAVSPAWPTAALAWVCVQGAFGALTVTMRLYPAIVTAHLLGGMALVALLAWQAALHRPAPIAARLRGAVAATLALVAVQVALGGWVSANYAVLACRDFPTCHGVWWPQADFARGFALLRPLGEAAEGGYLPFAALTAIHLAHRIGAAVVLGALAFLALRLWRCGGPAERRWACALGGLGLAQAASGVGNVVLGWPLAAALAHSAGAAALVALLAALCARADAASRRARPLRRRRPAPAGAREAAT